MQKALRKPGTKVLGFFVCFSFLFFSLTLMQIKTRSPEGAGEIAVIVRQRYFSRFYKTTTFKMIKAI
jgi:hypothetical protein